MYGNHVLQLNVHVIEKPTNGCAGCGRNHSNVWTGRKIGTEGVDAWNRATVPLPFVTERFASNEWRQFVLKSEGSVSRPTRLTSLHFHSLHSENSCVFFFCFCLFLMAFTLNALDRSAIGVATLRHMRRVPPLGLETYFVFEF